MDENRSLSLMSSENEDEVEYEDTLRCHINVNEDELKSKICKKFDLKPWQIRRLSYLCPSEFALYSSFPVDGISSTEQVIIGQWGVFPKPDKSELEKLNTISELQIYFKNTIGTNRFWLTIMNKPELFRQNGIIHDLIRKSKWGLQDGMHYVLPALPHMRFVYCGTSDTVEICVSKVGHFEIGENLVENICKSRCLTSDNFVAAGLENFNKPVVDSNYNIDDVFLFQKAYDDCRRLEIERMLSSPDGMTIVREYRIIMPLSLAEYNIGWLYTVNESSKNNTGGGCGVEWLENETFEGKTFINRTHNGRYTRKVLHLDKKLPVYAKAVLSKNNRCIDEESWNAFPYCRVELKPRLSDKFNIYTESIHLADRGMTDNAFGLSGELLAKRKVFYVDIVNDKVNPSDYKASEDPSKYQYGDRGKLKPNWRETCEPVMCAYKLIHVSCSWLMFAGKAEEFVAKQYPPFFLNGHRQMFCSMDKWLRFNLNDIRKMEDDTMAYLRTHLMTGNVRGPNAVE